MEPMPDLRRAVHRVLRRWSQRGQEHLPWDRMLVVTQRKQEQPVPDHDLIVKQIVMEALAELDEQGKGEEAQVLRLRFLDELTAPEVAARLNLITANVVHKRQSKGLDSLASVIGQMEQRALQERVDRIVERLAFADHPPLLFGVDEKLAGLTARLTDGQPPWIVTVGGIGGIGKTSLADAVVRRIAASPAFADIAWISARQEWLTPWGELAEDPHGLPALTFEGLLEALVDQLGFQDLARLPSDQRETLLKTRFQDRPYLVVVDNLETAADYQALVPALHALTRPTKFLLTGRRSLHRYPGVYSLELDELSEADSLALLRHEAAERGLAHIADAPARDLVAVYQVAGGNPLALKLLVGQMHLLSLPQVVDNLRQAQGKRIHDLYRYIYRRSWELLNDDARRVLAIMPLVAESGGGLDQIAALSELPDEALLAALEQLVDLCLVHVRGAVQERRYGIHRLTETFLLKEVHRWPDESP